MLDRKQNNKIYKQDVNDVCVQKDLYEEKWKNSTPELGKYVLDNEIEDYLADLESNVRQKIITWK